MDFEKTKTAGARFVIVRAGGGYWTMPYGEPEWVVVPAGKFWMGSELGDEDERPQHRLHLAEFRIARTPVTNAQYFIFTQAAGRATPEHWKDDRPPKGYEAILS